MWVNNVDRLDLHKEDYFYPWLTQTAQLTPLLRTLCTTLEIEVLNQQLTSAHISEQEVLKIYENNSLIREIFLSADGTPWIYARVVVPNFLYQQYKHEFDTLQNKPLGETMLYNRNQVQRSAFSFARLAATNWLHQLALCKLITPAIDILYARRSEFFFGNCSLLISEVFLPQLAQHPSQAC